MALTKISTGMLKQDAASSDLNIDAGTLYLDVSNNRVGVANTSPTATLDVSGYGKFTSSDGSPRIYLTGSGVNYFLTNTSGGLFGIYDNTNSTFRMVINSSGNVGIGTSSPSSILHLASASSPSFRIQDTTQNATFLAYAQDSNVHIGTSSNHPLIVDVNNTERMRLTSGGKILINETSFNSGYSSFAQVQITDSTAPGLVINTDTAGASNYGRLAFTVGNTTGNEGLIRYNSNDYHMSFWTNASEHMRITSGGNIGIGTTTSLVNKLNVNGNQVLLANGELRFADSTNSHVGTIKNSGSSGTSQLNFLTSSTERMRIDSSGNLFIGGTSATGAGERATIYGDVSNSAYPVVAVLADTSPYNSSGPQAGGGIGFAYKYNNGGSTAVGAVIQGLKENSTDGNYAAALTFRTRANGANPVEHMRITSTGRVRINNTVGSGWDSLGTLVVKQVADNIGIGVVDDLSSNTFMMRNNGGYAEMHYNVNLPIIFSQQGGERMRIDSSGNFLVGKSSSAFGTAGTELLADGGVTVTRSGSAGGTPFFVNRLSNDGELAAFYKDSTKVGSIGVIHGNNLTIGSTTASHIGLQFGTGIIYPADNTGSANDGAVALGDTNQRFSNLYLSGTAHTGLNIHLQDSGTTRGKIELNASDTDDLDIKAVSLGSNMKFFTVNTERMRIDASGNLRVGVGNTFEPTIQFTNSGRVVGNPGYSFNGDLDTGMFNPGTQGTIAFANNGSESMRIDSSGNLLVGTTNTVPGVGNTVAGISLYNDGRIFASKSGNTTMSLNRSSSNGGIVEFRKDGSTVGSISVNSGYIGVGAGAVYLGYYTDGSNNKSIIPMANSTGAAAAGTIGLGINNANHKFKDAWITGAVNAATLNINGGTIKLDGNYPVGTDNIALGNNSLSSSTGPGNIAIGDSVLPNITSSGSNAVAIGRDSMGTGAYSGGDAVAIGRSTLANLTSGSNNVAVGALALNANTTASNNTAVGYNAMTSNTTGTQSVGIGAFTLDSNTTGNYNVGVGYGVLSNSTTASDNTAMGLSAGSATTTGARNVLIGRSVAEALTTGSDNIYIGYVAGVSATTGNYNTAIGREAFRTQTTASYNTGLGYRVGYANTTGQNNVFIGYAAGDNNTTGSFNTFLGTLAGDVNTEGASNVAVGYAAFDGNSTGSNNTAVGTYSLTSNTTGTANTTIGREAGNSNTTGQYSTLIGYQAGRNQTTLGQNTHVGFQAGYYNTSAVNMTSIGYRAAHQAQGANVTAIGTQTLYSAGSGNDLVAVGTNSLFANTSGSENVAVGVEALRLNTTASYNTAVGTEALYTTATGGNNVAIGRRALYGNTSANNTAVGYNAAAGQTTGSATTAIGWNALQATVTGNHNVGVGNDALRTTTSGTGNVSVGSQSSYYNTTGTYNSALGYAALNANTTGAGHVAIGNHALDANTTGVENTAIGSYALTDNSTGSGNTAVGREALANNTTAGENVAVGKLAMYTTTTGGGNVAVGTQAMRLNTTGISNVATGHYALRENTTASYNTAVGQEALRYGNSASANSNTAVGFQAGYLTNAAGNTAIGVRALHQNSTGDSNVAIGYEAGKNYTSSNATFIGYEAGEHVTTGAQNVGIGRRALQDTTTGASNTSVGTYSMLQNTTGGSNTVLGYYALGNNTTANYNTAIGSLALHANTTANENTAVGYVSLYNNSTGARNTAVGFEAGKGITTGNDNTIVGGDAAAGITTGAGNTAIGRQALRVSTTANYNTSLGYSSMRLTTTGPNNTAVGGFALYNNTTGDTNVAVGKDSMLNNTTGTNNTALGARTLDANTTGTNNVAVGDMALGANTTANQNTGIGTSALEANTTGAGNTSIGYDSGSSNITGNNNTYVGAYAGEYSTGTANTFVGRAAGYAITSGQYNTILGRFSGNSGGLDIRTSSSNIVLSDGLGNARWYYNNGAWITNSNLGGAQGPGATTDHNSAELGSGYLNLQRDDTVAIKQILFAKNGSEVGSISTGASSTAYNTSSDYRLKENVVNLTGATARLKQLEPKRFNFIVDADTTVDGFLAHEVQSVVPEAITGTHNEVDSDGNPVYQGIDQSKLVPLLVATIKELEARITALESQ